MKTLPWKLITFQDGSGSWLEAYIPHLKWTYIIEESQTEGYICSFFPNNHCSDATALHKKPLRNLRNAKEACLNHLVATSRKIDQYLNPQTQKDETALTPTTEIHAEHLFEGLKENLNNTENQNPSNTNQVLFA